ncbi:MAG: hypothetical protein RMY34_04005 [Aulosira sp. DedQUE10]|nr:hypothetical protein [Aulosira sp. DedQUE10]
MRYPLIIGLGEVDNHDSIKLSTKKGNNIPNEKRKERHPDSLKAAEEIWKSKFANIKTRSLSGTYNCVGLVFGVRRTCIDIEEVSKILQDDEYQFLCDIKDVEVGDLVIYKHNQQYTHIGIVFNKESDIRNAMFKITILSQWGFDGEYLHLLEEVPYQYGKNYEFWTDRKLVK